MSYIPKVCGATRLDGKDFMHRYSANHQVNLFTLKGLDTAHACLHHFRQHISPHAQWSYDLKVAERNSKDSLTDEWIPDCPAGDVCLIERCLSGWIIRERAVVPNAYWQLEDFEPAPHSPELPLFDPTDQRRGPTLLTITALLSGEQHDHCVLGIRQEPLIAGRPFTTLHTMQAHRPLVCDFSFNPKQDCLLDVPTRSGDFPKLNFGNVIGRYTIERRHLPKLN